MSSTTEIPEVREYEYFEQVDTSSVEEGAAEPQRRVTDQAQPVVGRVHISTLFTSSILNGVENVEQTQAGKKEITEEEAAAILVLMRRAYAVTGQETRMGGPRSSQAARRSASLVSSTSTSSATVPPTKETKKGARSTRKKAGTNPKNLAPVTRRGSSTVAVFAPRAKTKPKKANLKENAKCGRNNYNVFRTKASKLLGTKVINECREGSSFNGKIAKLWKEVSDDDKTTFSGWTSVEQKAYLVKLAKGAQPTEGDIDVALVKKKAVKVATRVQPRRIVEGKTKK